MAGAPLMLKLGSWAMSRTADLDEVCTGGRPHKEVIMQSFGGRQGVVNVADVQGNREKRGINFEGAQAAERWNNMEFGDEKPTGGGGISVVGTGRISAEFMGPGLLPIRESVCNIRVSITDGDGVSGEEGDGVDKTSNGYVICVVDEGKVGISGGEGWTTQPLSFHYSGLGGWLDAAAKAGRHNKMRESTQSATQMVVFTSGRVAMWNERPEQRSAFRTVLRTD
ncbi:hypothetical protein DFH09DRAFT_1111705 [Mycena vulgaris]|nr:hypothetical protein DFH09DRAFT_1111705 [Mycena vulgaris]